MVVMQLVKNFYLRFIKTLTYNGVEYYLYERMLPQAFTLFAGQGENAPKLTINAVNIQNDYFWQKAKLQLVKVFQI